VKKVVKKFRDGKEVKGIKLLVKKDDKNKKID